MREKILTYDLYACCSEDVESFVGLLLEAASEVDPPSSHLPMTSVYGLINWHRDDNRPLSSTQLAGVELPWDEPKVG